MVDNLAATPDYPKTGVVEAMRDLKAIAKKYDPHIRWWALVLSFTWFLPPGAESGVVSCDPAGTRERRRQEQSARSAKARRTRLENAEAQRL